MSDEKDPVPSEAEGPVPADAAVPAALEAPPPVEAAGAEPPAEPSVEPAAVAARLLPVPLERSVLDKAQLYVSSMSIRYKIAGALVAVLCLAIASLGMVSFSQQKKVLQQEMRRRADVLGRQVAASAKTALLAKDELSLYSAIRGVAEAPGVAYAFVQDRNGLVFVHSDLSRKGRKLTEGIDRLALESEEPLVQDATAGDEPVLDASFPLIVRFGAKTLRVGTVRVGLSQKPLVEAIRRQKAVFVAITAAFVVLGLLISFALGQVLTQPIYVLATGMQTAAQGDLSRLVHVTVRDEIGALADNFNDMILKLREKIHMERYLPGTAMKAIRRLRGEDRLRLGGERRPITVLFSDVRGFTAMSEAMEPEEVVELLNLYLNLQAEVVIRHGGTIDKFVGDEVMALFLEDDAELRAARAAHEIQSSIRALNSARARVKKRVISVGIGLNSGDVVMGNMGSERLMNFTVIGDPINVAARLCSQAAPGQVLLSPSVADAAGTRVSVKPLARIELKGKREPMEVHELLHVSGAGRQSLRRPVAAQASYRLTGLGDTFQCRTADLSAGGCLLESETPLGLGTQLEVSAPALGGTLPGSVRGTVLHVRREDGRFRCGVAFNGLSEEDRARITEWVFQVETQTAHVETAAAGPQQA